MQKSAFCRSRRELSNAYLLAKFGLDTAENEPSKVCPDADAVDLRDSSGGCAGLRVRPVRRRTGPASARAADKEEV